MVLHDDIILLKIIINQQTRQGRQRAPYRGLSTWSFYSSIKGLFGLRHVALLIYPAHRFAGIFWAWLWLLSTHALAWRFLNPHHAPPAWRALPALPHRFIYV